MRCPGLKVALARAIGPGAMMAFCLVAAVCLGRAAAVEPPFRDLLRRYVGHLKEAEDLKDRLGFPAEVSQAIGLEYAVLLRKDGLDEAVDPAKHAFQAGDQIRVRIQPLNDIYVYVFFEDDRGCRRCLLPSDKNSTRLAKHDLPIELPNDGGVFEFEAGAKRETLVLIATERPDANLTTLCEAVCKKRQDRLTPEDRAVQTDLRSKNDKELSLIHERLSKAVAFRGRLSAPALTRLSAEMKQIGAQDALLEEPPLDKQTSTLMVLFSNSGSPVKLAVTIPLRSAAAETAKLP